MVFFLPLPDALPFEHGTTYSFILDEDERLAGIGYQPTRETPPLPEDTVGHLFVSLKFWQVKEKYAEFMAEFEAVERVMHSVIPAEFLGKEDPKHRGAEAMGLLPKSYRTQAPPFRLRARR